MPLINEEAGIHELSDAREAAPGRAGVIQGVGRLLVLLLDVAKAHLSYYSAFGKPPTRLQGAVSGRTGWHSRRLEYDIFYT